MIISHKHRFIYIKSNKTAGTSTEILLEKICGKDDIVTPITKGDAPSHKPRNYKGFDNHSTLEYIKNNINTDAFNSYFKFVNIRNPYDREVSGYYWKTNPNEISFKDYLIKSVYRNYSKYYRIDGEPHIDGVVRYENLREDLNTLSKRFNWGLDDLELPQAKTTSRKNAKHKHYTEYYDDETRQIVAEKYAKDIEYFEYEFGD
jgi:hypothetical protein